MQIEIRNGQIVNTLSVADQQRIQAKFGMRSALHIPFAHVGPTAPHEVTFSNTGMGKILQEKFLESTGDAGISNNES